MSFLMDVIGKKLLSALEDELISHEPAIQAMALAELQSFGSVFVKYVEDKINALEHKESSDAA